MLIRVEETIMDRKPTFAPFSFSADSFGAPNPFLPASQPIDEPVRASDAVWSHDVADDALAPDAVDVRVLWGTNVLFFDQMSPPRPFRLAEVGDDLALPDSIPGGSALVVLHGDRPAVLVVPGSTLEVRLANAGVLSLAECAQRGMARASTETMGAQEVTLPEGAIATLRFDGSDLTFEVTRGKARQQPVTGFFAGADLSGQLYTGLSALVHATLIGTLAFFLPAMHNDDADAIDRNAAAAMQPYLTAIAEREPTHEESVTEATGATAGGASPGSQAAGPSGTMGTTVPTPTSGRFAIKGDAPEPKLQREQALLDSATWGMIGLLATDATNPNTPVASWGEQVAVGNESRNALGSLWAPTIDDAFGQNGLGISGLGEGGGGKFHGVGINGVGSTVGGGSGCVAGQPCLGGPGHGPGTGAGFGHDPGGGGHTPKAPRMIVANTEINGTLPAEVVQRIVRQNFGRFKMCYEAGLRTNPGLTGRVAVKFMIDRNGSVATAAADPSTDMADGTVVSCVVRGFLNLSFPEPKSGMVKVIYPLMLSPGE